MGTQATDAIDTETDSTVESSDEEGDDETREVEQVAEPTPLPLDQVFDVLRNERRRRALRYLIANGGWATMSELAESVAAYETEKPVAELTSSERKRVYVALYQCHLPKMDDIQVIEFNKPRGIIELGPNAAVLDRYLESAESLGTAHSVHEADSNPPSTEPWAWYYGSLTVVGTVLFLFSLGLGAPAVQLVLGLVLLAFGVCSVIHLRETGASQGLVGRFLDSSTTD